MSSLAVLPWPTVMRTGDVRASRTRRSTLVGSVALKSSVCLLGRTCPRMERTCTGLSSVDKLQHCIAAVWDVAGIASCQQYSMGHFCTVAEFDSVRLRAGHKGVRSAVCDSSVCLIVHTWSQLWRT